MSNRLIAPSVLAADFSRLKEEVEMLNDSSADYILIDIMDGVFVPNISFGFPVCEAIHRHAQKPMDFHLMIQDADPYLESCKSSGAEIISVHFEATTHLHRTLSAIRELGCKAGVVLNPHTPVDVLRDVTDSMDLLLIMSVNPGFGGQKFIPHTYQKVRDAKVLREQSDADFLIEIDGGVNRDNAGKLFDAGADMLVAGSSVFKADDPSEMIDRLKEV